MAIISTLPYNISNGTLEDANQVMGNFNQIVSQVNTNLSALTGAGQIGATASPLLSGITVQAQLSQVGNFTAASWPYTLPLSGAVATTVGAKLSQTVSVQDFGADPTGLTDSTSAIQAAINAAQTAGQWVWFQPGGTYYIVGGLTFKQGKSAIDSQSFFVGVFGNGATLLPGPGVAAISIQPRCLLSDIATGRANAPIYIRDLNVNGFYSTALSPSQALAIGTTGYMWDALQWSSIDNFTSYGFTMPTGVETDSILLQEGRHIRFNGLQVLGPSGGYGGTCRIQGSAAGSFTGDMVFNACEFRGNGLQPPLILQSGIGGTNASIRGIKFLACDIYGGGTHIYGAGGSSGSNSQIGDIWFTAGCQFDQPASGDIQLWLDCSSQYAQMFQIHITDNYFVGANNANAIYASCGASGYKQKLIDISGNHFNSATIGTAFGSAVVCFANANGYTFSRNQFDGITGAAATYYIANNICTNFLISDNLATNNSGVTSSIGLASTNNNFTITNNQLSSLVIVDNTTTATKTITGNQGYNPIGVTSITVSGSPFTWTNQTGSPVFVTISGGTVSTITLDGKNVGTSTNTVVPVPQGGQLTTTYSSLPAMFYGGLL